MNLIVAADNGWGIGKSGNLLYSIPEDMKFFRKMTAEKCVIMGRATLESLPGGNPLPKRRNIILSKSLTSVSGAEVYATIEDVVRAVENESPGNVFVIGGESVYRDMLPFCDTAYITRVDAKSDADRFMVNLDEHPEWEVAERSEVLSHNGLGYSFVTYKRKV